MQPVSKIVLNVEQSKRFLSFFVQEAIEIANKRLEEKVLVEKTANGS